MKSLLYFLFFLSSVQALYAQLQPIDQAKNDSLLIVLRKGTTDSIQARAAFHLAKIWINIDSAQGLKYLEKGKSLAKSNEYLNAIYRYQAITSYKDEQEVDFLLNIFRKYDNPDSWDYIYRITINRVRWLNNRPRSDEALAMLKKDIIPLVDKLKTPAYLAEVPLEMGRAFLNQGMDDEAVQYLEKSAERYENIQPKSEPILYNHIHVLGSLANVYNTLRNNKKADSVIHRAKELLKIQPNFPQELRIASYEAMHLVLSEQYKAAETLVDQMLAKSKGVPRHYLLNLHFQRYKALAGMKDYHKALSALQQSHPIDSIQIDLKTYGSVDLSKILQSYAIAYEDVDDYKQASQYWKRYVKHRDSVSKDEIATEISKLEVQLRTQEKDAAIDNLKIEKDKADLKIKNQQILNWLFALATGLLLTLLGFILYIYKNKQQATSNRIKQLETANKLEVTKALLEGEERERQRIGRDLHDSLGGSLSGIRMQLSESQQQQPEPILDRAIVQLEDSIAEVRRIARNMVPESLLCSGLDTGLQDLCVAFSSADVAIEYQSAGISANLPVNIQTNIYRIVQELLVNALKHGKANNIIVQCIQSKNTILLTVEDNGKGFSITDAQHTPGIGLKNVQRRVDYMQGQYNIESAPGHGTTINIEIHVN